VASAGAAGRTSAEVAVGTAEQLAGERTRDPRQLPPVSALTRVHFRRLDHTMFSNVLGSHGSIAGAQQDWIHRAPWQTRRPPVAATLPRPPYSRLGYVRRDAFSMVQRPRANVAARSPPAPIHGSRSCLAPLGGITAPTAHRSICQAHKPPELDLSAHRCRVQVTIIRAAGGEVCRSVHSSSKKISHRPLSSTMRGGLARNYPGSMLSTDSQPGTPLSLPRPRTLGE